MKSVIAVMGIGLYLLAIELSAALAPRWGWVWWTFLALHSLLVLAVTAWSALTAVRQRLKAGAPGSLAGSSRSAPADRRED
jgi:hypothetical protein